MVDWLKKVHLNFADTAHDSAADVDCLHAALKKAGFETELSYKQLMRWYETIREADFDVTVTLLNVTSPYYPELTDETFRLARIAFGASLDLRRTASAALDLCYVAAGRVGLFFEIRLNLWDYAAGILIAEEAGGKVCTLYSEAVPVSLEKSSVVAGGRQALADFMALIGKAEQ